MNILPNRTGCDLMSADILSLHNSTLCIVFIEGSLFMLKSEELLV